MSMNEDQTISTDEMKIVVALDERLANPGDSLPVAGHVELSGYRLGDHEFTLPEGMDYDVVLTNAGEGILATGILKAHVEGICDRCLEKAEFDVASEVDEYYLFHAPDNAGAEKVTEDEDGEEAGVDYALVSDDSTIDLTDAVMGALLMDTPYVVLCRPDCRGLCPDCGANLNEGDCGCAARREAEELSQNPFAVLKDLHLDEQ